MLDGSGISRNALIAVLFPPRVHVRWRRAGHIDRVVFGVRIVSAHEHTVIHLVIIRDESWLHQRDVVGPQPSKPGRFFGGSAQTCLWRDQFQDKPDPRQRRNPSIGKDGRVNRRVRVGRGIAITPCICGFARSFVFAAKVTIQIEPAKRQRIRWYLSQRFQFQFRTLLIRCGRSSASAAFSASSKACSNQSAVILPIPASSSRLEPPMSP